MARRRKYYIPITRSGSSILASIITQWINQPRPKQPSRPMTGSDLACWIILIVSILTITFWSIVHSGH